jgi:hypothetical protein
VSGNRVVGAHPQEMLGPLPKTLTMNQDMQIMCVTSNDQLRQLTMEEMELVTGGGKGYLGQAHTPAIAIALVGAVLGAVKGAG